MIEYIHLVTGRLPSELLEYYSRQTEMSGMEKLAFDFYFLSAIQKEKSSKVSSVEEKIKSRRRNLKLENYLRRFKWQKKQVFT